MLALFKELLSLSIAHLFFPLVEHLVIWHNQLYIVGFISFYWSVWCFLLKLGLFILLLHGYVVEQYTTLLFVKYIETC
jgi:hypothetical protein